MAGGAGTGGTEVSTRAVAELQTSVSSSAVSSQGAGVQRPVGIGAAGSGSANEGGELPPPKIHPTAVVDPRAELSPGVVIGPYVVIDGPVKIGRGTKILAHSVLDGPTEIGAFCDIGPAAWVGLLAQHLKGAPEDSWLVVGDYVRIREGASIHRSMYSGREHATRVGNHCFVMGCTHLAHDVVLDDHVVVVNGAGIAGHVHVGERAFIAGGTVIHQFVRIGKLALTRGNEPVGKDVPPYGALGLGGLKAYNAVGCRRAGLSPAALRAIRSAYHIIHSHRTAAGFMKALREVENPAPEFKEIVDFITSSKRGVPVSTRYLHRSAAADDEE